MYPCVSSDGWHYGCTRVPVMMSGNMGEPIVSPITTCATSIWANKLDFGTMYLSHCRAMKVRKRANIRNRYNQAPHLTKDTNEEVTTSHLDISQ